MRPRSSREIARRKERGAKKYAKVLRGRATPTEAMVWERIRDEQLGVHFRREHVIWRYVVDFCCPQLRLVVEVDGAVHRQERRKERDRRRDFELRSRGYTVLRFTARRVERDLNGVVGEIAGWIERRGSEACR